MCLFTKLGFGKALNLEGKQSDAEVRRGPGPVPAGALPQGVHPAVCLRSSIQEADDLVGSLEGGRQEALGLGCLLWESLGVGSSSCWVGKGWVVPEVREGSARPHTLPRLSCSKAILWMRLLYCAGKKVLEAHPDWPVGLGTY